MTPRPSGAEGNVNPRVKMSREEECDERKQSIKVKIPPLGISVFQYTKVVEKISDNKTAKGKKRQAAKKRDLKKELQEKIEEKRRSKPRMITWADVEKWLPNHRRSGL